MAVAEQQAIRGDTSCTGLDDSFDTVPDASLKTRKVPGDGRMWNIRTDAAVIESVNPSFWSFTNHNAYVQTNWTALLVELAFAAQNSQ